MNSSLRVTPQTRSIMVSARQGLGKHTGTVSFAGYGMSELKATMNRIKTKRTNAAQERKVEALARYRNGTDIAQECHHEGETLKLQGPDVLQLIKIALDKKSLWARFRKGPVFAHQIIPGYSGNESLLPLVTLINADFLARHKDFRDAYNLTPDGVKELKNLARNEATEPARSRWRHLGHLFFPGKSAQPK
ncbi:MAG TPA: hypothetical protein V6C52_00015 [Coleofasciculaceae cyanobacterium]